MGTPRETEAPARARTGALAFGLLFAALLVLLALRSRGDAWVGDFWIYVATIGEASARPLHPKNPLFGNDYAFAFFTPYLVGLGLFARWTGAAAIDVLTGQGLVNLVLLGAALYGFVATWVRRAPAAFYALLFLLFLWGSDPWVFSGFFHLRSLAYVLPYPSTFAAALALGTLALFPRLAERSIAAWAPSGAAVAVVVWIVHPVTGLFLWIGLGCASLAKPRSWGHWVVLAVTAAATFGLALAWPLVPMRELWFGQLARVHEGNDTMYSEPLRRIGPALLGVPWLVVRLVRDRRDPLGLLAASLGLLVVYGGVSHAWSYGRLVSYAVLMLHVALADAVVNGEDVLVRRLGASWPRLVIAPALTILLVAGSWRTVAGVVWEWRPGDRRWLSFLEGRVGRDDVVLTDLETCWYLPAFSGKVVAYPMQLPFVPDHAERRAAVERFFALDTAAEERRATLARYGVRYVLLAREHFADGAGRLRVLDGLGETVYSSEAYDLISVGPLRDRPPPG